MAAEHADKKQKMADNSVKEIDSYTSLTIICDRERHWCDLKGVVLALGVLRFPDSPTEYEQRVDGKFVHLTQHNPKDDQRMKQTILLTSGFGKFNQTPRLIPNRLILFGTLAMTFEHETGNDLYCYVADGASLEIICDNSQLNITLVSRKAKLIKVRGKCRSIKVLTDENPGVPLIDWSEAKCLDFSICHNNFDSIATIFVISPSGEKKLHVSDVGDVEWLPTDTFITNRGKFHVNFPQPHHLQKIKDGVDDGFDSRYVTY